MLAEEEPAVRTQHPPDLIERGLGIWHGAEDHRRDNRVDGVGRHRKRLGTRAQDASTDTAPVKPQFETASHRVDWLAEDELLELIGIVRQVETGPGSDLEYRPTRPSEQAPASLVHPATLAQRKERVIGGGDEPRPDAARPVGAVVVLSVFSAAVSVFVGGIGGLQG